MRESELHTFLVKVLQDLGLDVQYEHRRDSFLYTLKQQVDCTICDMQGFFIIEEEIDGEIQEGEHVPCPACKGVGTLQGFFKQEVSNEHFAQIIRKAAGLPSSRAKFF